MQKLRSIQILRAVAAIGVVLIHAYSFDNDPNASPLRLGAAGVDLFFVISGFIIASIPKASPGQFLFDRAWRIYPIWLIAAAPFLTYGLPPITTALATLTLWPVYDRFTVPMLSIGWTLSFEMLFYLAAAVALRTGVRSLIAAYGLSLAAGLALGWPLFDFIGNPLIIEFLLGVAIARAPRFEALAGPAIGIAVLLLALAPLELSLRVFALDAQMSLWRVLFWGLPAAMIVYGALSLERRLPSLRPLVALGDASYSIYLFHLLVAEYVPAPWPVKAVAAIAAGMVAHYAIERPILRRKDRVRNWFTARLPARRDATPSSQPG